MSYEVVLDEFQGPLDLLLHLIKEKEMDLESLEVSVITDQYLAFHLRYRGEKWRVVYHLQWTNHAE